MGALNDSSKVVARILADVYPTFPGNRSPYSATCLLHLNRTLAGAVLICEHSLPPNLLHWVTFSYILHRRKYELRNFKFTIFTREKKEKLHQTADAHNIVNVLNVLSNLPPSISLNYLISSEFHTKVHSSLFGLIFPSLQKVNV